MELEDATEQWLEERDGWTPDQRTRRAGLVAAMWSNKGLGASLTAFVAEDPQRSVDRLGVLVAASTFAVQFLGEAPSIGRCVEAAGIGAGETGAATLAAFQRVGVGNDYHRDDVSASPRMWPEQQGSGEAQLGADAPTSTRGMTR